MDKRGEFKLTSMLFGVLLAFGLFFTLIATIINTMGGLYDTSGFDEDSLDNYSHLDSLKDTIEERADQIDTQVSVDKNIFDYFAGIFASIIEPFKFIYKSYETLFTVTNRAVIDLNLFPVFATWVKAVLITLVVIGIVMFRVYLKVKQ